MRSFTTSIVLTLEKFNPFTVVLAPSMFSIGLIPPLATKRSVPTELSCNWIPDEETVSLRSAIAPFHVYVPPEEVRPKPKKLVVLLVNLKR